MPPNSKYLLLKSMIAKSTKSREKKKGQVMDGIMALFDKKKYVSQKDVENFINTADSERMALMKKEVTNFSPTNMAVSYLERLEMENKIKPVKSPAKKIVYTKI
jgi:transcriptional regulator NrdR family protein